MEGQLPEIAQGGGDGLRRGLASELGTAISQDISARSPLSGTGIAKPVGSATSPAPPGGGLLSRSRLDVNQHQGQGDESGLVTCPAGSGVRSSQQSASKTTVLLKSLAKELGEAVQISEDNSISQKGNPKPFAVPLNPILEKPKTVGKHWRRGKSGARGTNWFREQAATMEAQLGGAKDAIAEIKKDAENNKKLPLDEESYNNVFDCKEQQDLLGMKSDEVISEKARKKAHAKRAEIIEKVETSKLKDDISKTEYRERKLDERPLPGDIQRNNYFKHTVVGFSEENPSLFNFLSRFWKTYLSLLYVLLITHACLQTLSRNTDGPFPFSLLIIQWVVISMYQLIIIVGLIHEYTIPFLEVVSRSKYMLCVWMSCALGSITALYIIVHTLGSLNDYEAPSFLVFCIILFLYFFTFSSFSLIFTILRFTRIGVEFNGCYLKADADSYELNYDGRPVPMRNQSAVIRDPITATVHFSEESNLETTCVTRNVHLEVVANLLSSTNFNTYYAEEVINEKIVSSHRGTGYVMHDRFQPIFGHSQMDDSLYVACLISRSYHAKSMQKSLRTLRTLNVV